jgi:hypothetical protein
MPAIDLKLNDIISLRKKHPCGSNEWQVVQVGIDIRIQCLGCQHHILMDRFVLQRKIKAVISRNPMSESSKMKPSE